MTELWTGAPTQQTGRRRRCEFGRGPGVNSAAGLSCRPLRPHGCVALAPYADRIRPNTPECAPSRDDRNFETHSAELWSVLGAREATLGSTRPSGTGTLLSFVTCVRVGDSRLQCQWWLQL